MSHVYNPSPVAITSSTLPDDGDLASAVSVNTPFEDALDGVKYCQNSIDGTSTGTMVPADINVGAGLFYVDPAAGGTVVTGCPVLATAAVQCNTTLGVAGAVTCSSTLSVVGAATCSSSLTVLGTAIFKDSGAVNMLEVDHDDNEIRFKAGNTVSLANGALVTGNLVNFASGTSLDFTSGSSITGNASCTATITLSGSGHVVPRAIDGASSGNQTYSVATADVIFAPAQAGNVDWTISNATDGAEISLNGYDVTNPAAVITVKNQSGSTIFQLANASSGNICAARLSYKAVTSSWRIVIKELTP